MFVRHCTVAAAAAAVGLFCPLELNKASRASLKNSRAGTRLFPDSAYKITTAIIITNVGSHTVIHTCVDLFPSAAFRATDKSV